jgi:hypothetical protein
MRDRNVRRKISLEERFARVNKLLESDAFSVFRDWRTLPNNFSSLGKSDGVESTLWIDQVQTTLCRLHAVHEEGRMQQSRVLSD